MTAERRLPCGVNSAGSLVSSGGRGAPARAPGSRAPPARAGPPPRARAPRPRPRRSRPRRWASSSGSWGSDLDARLARGSSSTVRLPRHRRGHARARRRRARACRGRRCAAPAISCEIEAPVSRSSTAQHQEHEREVRAGVREERRGHPVERLADDAAAVHHLVGVEQVARRPAVGSEAERPGREPEGERGDQHERARAHRAAATRGAAARRARRPAPITNSGTR